MRGNGFPRIIFFMLSLLAIRISIAFPFLSQYVFAQVTTGTILGTITDETGAVLPGALIKVRHLETAFTRTGASDKEGRYQFPALPLGNYEVSAERAGFQPAVRGGIKLTVGREAVVDLTLKVGEMQEKVTVTGEAPLIDTTSSTMTGLVDDKKIRDLPLNARDFAQLTLLFPGVLPSREAGKTMTHGFGLKFSVAGSRPNQSSFLLDGTDINDALDQPSSAAGVLAGVETLREFSILTNSYSAEYGRSGGGIINAVTKSGTNEFHGSLFEFIRNDKLDARNFFDPSQKPPFKRNQFGGTFGGPLRRNKTFFLLSYEGLRERLGVTRVATVPNVLARQGLLPNSVGGPVVVAPAVRSYLNLFPLPNGPDFGDGTAQHVFSQSRPMNENYFQIRVDHNFSDRDAFFARYTFDDSFFKEPLEYPMFRQDIQTRNQYLTIEERKIFSPTLLNTFRFGFNRSKLSGDNSLLTNIPQSLSFVPGEKFGSILIRGFQPFGTRFTLPRANYLNLFEWADHITYTKGRSSIKAGLNIKRFQTNILTDVRRGGQYEFASLRSFLTNSASFFQGMVPGTSSIRSWSQSFFGFYVQDDLMLRRNFTLNLGLRYEFITEPVEKHGRVASLRSIMDSDTTIGKLFQNPSLRSFGPRFGFAWDPFSDGKTSIRGGFGIFYDQLLPKDYVIPGSRIPPFFQEVRVDRPVPFPNAFDVIRRGTPLRTVLLLQFDPQTPYVMQYNLNLQRQIFADTLLTIGYVGSRGVHLTSFFEANTAVPQIFDGRKFFAPGLSRRNPRFSSITLRATDSNSFYNSLQIGINKRFSRGLQMQGSYTLSKSIDDASGDLGSSFVNTPAARQDSDDRKLDRALSSFDVRHNFVFNYTYDLPLGNHLEGPKGKLVSGWQVNGITSISSGTPFTVHLGFNRSRNQALGFRLGDRPNLKNGRSRNTSGLVLGGPNRYFDVGAFELPPAGFFGDAPRNAVTGPRFVNFDFSLVKNTYIGKNTNKNLQFKIELFNLFNHPNFAAPRNTDAEFGGVIIFNDPRGVPVGNAGQIIETVSTARQIQFGIKAIF